ncbi:hypothetical protein PLICRDRAFT_696659 [Plicaturopsis crispa FD-325 SS-3]|nr:hypothetical protein PLICRDRAFT_696659 [Plicaturopsis crispa FD-325 SS-3]
MSDSEGDIDDELLELAGATEKKRKRRQAPSKSSKRRKASVSTDSENDVESEEDESNPYPLEGKYIDEADRQRLMQMSEIEREETLAQRLEELQRIQDKRNLDDMLKKQQRGDNSVSQAAKRQHAVRGATKEKSRKLDELKAKRKEKGEKKRTKNSPKRDRSSSPTDMEISDEEEDGQITKYEEAEEKDRRLLNKANPDEEPITIEDLNSVRVTRDMLAKYAWAPWFEDYAKGAWVRYLIGQEGGQPVYRICEIFNLAADKVKPYKVNDKIVDQAFELKHGKSVRQFLMDKVSNTPFDAKEFDRVVKVCSSESVKLPTKRQLEKKAAALHKLANQPMTESDISAMLARKNLLNKQGTNFTMEKSRLNQARTLAHRRQDWAEVAEIDQKLVELAATIAAAGGGPAPPREDDFNDILAKVNERNRKANIEAVRKAELAEAERKRRERKLAAAGGTTTPHDPSARLRTIPRTFNSASRPGTPSLQAQGAKPTGSLSPLPASALSGQTGSDKAKNSYESNIIDSVEIDLGDF